MMFQLAVTAMNIGERTAYAGRVLLIGMMTVFASLAILWGALEIFRLFVARPKKAAQPAAPVAEPAVAAETADDGELIAAITAAVAAVLAEENGGAAPAFRVVSYKRINR